LLLGLSGVGLAYIFISDAEFRRNSWYGLGAWMIIWLLLVLATAKIYFSNSIIL